MTPISTFARRSLVSLAVLLSCQAVAAAQAPWPVSPSRLQLPTPYGNLQVASSEYIYESRLQINNVDVDPQVSGIINITYAFNMSASQAALISINNGNNNCPISYRWVVLEKSGYKLSPEFGSCNDKIRVTATERQLTLRTPNPDAPGKIDVYVYDGKTIKRSTTRVKP
ncbi:hypothetical protein H0A66_03680 [Alcaligenaceae bacterium]|nr:hypothetical protein [Alcaligenaceae bacterium]